MAVTAGGYAPRMIFEPIIRKKSVVYIAFAEQIGGR